jgi:hypothetical protein
MRGCAIAQAAASGEAGLDHQARRDRAFDYLIAACAIAAARCAASAGLLSFVSESHQNEAFANKKFARFYS